MRMIPLAAILAVSVSAPVFAADPAPPAGWQMNCQPGICMIARSVIANNSEAKGPAATLLMSVNDEGAHFLGAVMPLGVALVPGVRLVNGDTFIEARMEVCLPDGCRASAPVTAEQIANLRQWDTVDLRFFNTSDARQYSIPFPLDGVAEAIDTVEAAVKNHPAQ